MACGILNDGEGPAPLMPRAASWDFGSSGKLRYAIMAGRPPPISIDWDVILFKVSPEMSPVLPLIRIYAW